MMMTNDIQQTIFVPSMQDVQEQEEEQEQMFRKCSNLADIWHKKFILDTEYRMSYGYVCSHEELTQALCDIYDFSAETKVTPTDIFNSFNYNTYFGNFSHGICQKVFEMLRMNIDICKIMPYLNILFHIISTKMVDLRTRDYYRSTPYEMCHYLSHTPHNYTLIMTNSDAFKVVKMLVNILDPEYCIVTVIQTHVRSWLSKRRVQRIRFLRVLEDILYSPSKQVETHFYPTFPGGKCYLEMQERFEEKGVEELTQLLCV